MAETDDDSVYDTRAGKLIYLKEHGIQVEGTDVPLPWPTLAVAGLPDSIKAALRSNGIRAPTPIQAQAWPLATSGQDLLGLADTGSGKTLAYAVPCVLHAAKAVSEGSEHREPSEATSPRDPSTLILAPTRELVLQIEAQIAPYCVAFALKHLGVYGGAGKATQSRALRAGIDVVIATPGRLLDFAATGAANLASVTCVVLDEADKMLSMGFEPQVNDLLVQTATPRQTMLWSATWPEGLNALASVALRDPVRVVVRGAGLRVLPHVAQEVRVVAEEDKAEALERLLEGRFDGGRVLCFCATRRQCDTLTRMLRTRGWPALGTHGDKGQVEREWVLQEFRSGANPILVATDVAARGLDVEDIQLVVNYDMPTVPNYIHRVGRTGRAGRPGSAVTFFVRGTDARVARPLVRLLLDAQQPVHPDLVSLAASRHGAA